MAKSMIAVKVSSNRPIAASEFVA